MRDFMVRVRARLSSAWQRVRGWFIGVLIALGVIAGAAFAATQSFNWTNPTQNVDGSAFDPATELAEVRIYCNLSPTAFTPESPGVTSPHTPALVSPGDLTTAARDFAAGDYTCFATAFSIYGYESAPSNTVTFTVTPTVAPEAPVLTLGPQS